MKTINDKISKKDKELDTMENLKPSKELQEALQEGEDILNGKIKVKGYHNVKEMFEDILKEE